MMKIGIERDFDITPDSTYEKIEWEHGKVFCGRMLHQWKDVH